MGGYIGYCTIMYFNPVLEDKFLAPTSDDKPPSVVTKLDKVAPVPDTGSTGDQGEPNDQPHHIRVAQPKFNRSQSIQATNESARTSKRDSRGVGDLESDGADKKAT